MSIFANTGFGSEIVACEGYGVETFGNYDAFMESCDDHMAIIEAMHKYELAELEYMKESSDCAAVVMEASVKEIWQKLKDFVVNLGKKILGFFKKLIIHANSIFMSSEAFANKYEQQILEADIADMPKQELFKYNIETNNIEKDIKLGMKMLEEAKRDVLDLPNKFKVTEQNVTSVMAQLSKADSEYDDLVTHIIATTVKEITGGITSNPDEFQSAVYKHLRGGKDKKDSVKISKDNLKQMVKFMKTANKDYMKNLKKCNKDLTDAFKDMQKAIETSIKEVEHGAESKELQPAYSKQANLMRKALNTVSKLTNFNTRYMNALITATKEAISTYKNICYKAMTFKKKKSK